VKRSGDYWGGLTAMLVVLPSSVAYGVTAYSLLGPDYVGHGVRAGIIGAVALGLIASAIGGAQGVISAPSAPAGAVLAALIGGMLAVAEPAPSADRILALLMGIVVLAGMLQVTYGAVGGGKLIKYIPYPVVSGFMTAVGVLIVIGQLPRILGYTHGVDSSSVIIGAVTIATMIVAPKITRAVPATILALTAGVAAYFALALFRPALLHLDGNALVIGRIGGGSLLAGIGDQWAGLAGLGLSDIPSLIVPAVTLSVLLSIDALKTYVVVDSLTHERHDSRRALFGQGAANVVSACLRGMPGAATTGPTLVSIESGGRTQRAGILEGAFLLVVALVLGKWIAWLPVAALAGILIVIGIRMCDWDAVYLLRQRSTVLDFIVIAAVVVVAVASDLIVAAIVGVALSMLLFVREQIRGSVIRRRISGDKLASKQHRIPAERAVLDRLGAQIVVAEVQGSLFFGTTDQLYTELDADLKRCRYLILDLRRVQSLDYTAVHLFEQFAAMLAKRDGFLLFSRLPARRELREYFSQSGVVKPNHNVRKFETLDDALLWAEDRILAEAIPKSDAIGEPPLELKDFELASTLGANELAALASSAEVRSYAAGSVIFRMGEGSDELLLIRSGVVRITLPLSGDDYHTVASFGRGDFFGEMAFMDGAARSASAMATAPVDVYAISRARFDNAVESNPAVGLRFHSQMAHALAVRLRRANSELRALYEA
jgi:sulfate permease, SulP family